MRIKDLPTLNDVQVGERRVLVRVDFNCPLDREGNILDDSRMRAHVPTIRKLLDGGAAVVVTTHQGRPGNEDFRDLANHAELLSTLLGTEVRFIDDVMGPEARKQIRELGYGEVLMLDNIRFVSEEVVEAPPEMQAKTYLVRRLAPLFDLFVFDAFATAHRSQPSIVGFPMVLPSVMGELMRKELEALRRVLEASEPPRIFVLGGAKVRDTIRIIEYLTRNGIADRILTTGLVGLVFHVAKGGRVGRTVMKFLEEKGLLGLIPRARRVVLSGAPLDTPYDLRVLKDDGTVAEETVHNLTGKPMDVGPYTVAMYSELIREAKVVVMRGPAGRIEDPRFRSGTEDLLRAALRSNAFVVIGGGHLGAMARSQAREGIHISTGGGALLFALSGETLPAVAALEESARRFLKRNPRKGGDSSG